MPVGTDYHNRSISGLGSRVNSARKVSAPTGKTLRLRMVGSPDLPVEVTEVKCMHTAPMCVVQGGLVIECVLTFDYEHYSYVTVPQTAS